MSFKKLIVTAALAFASVVHAQPEYNPGALEDVIECAEAVEARGQTPVVMFDLDDTLTNTRERNVRILNDFVNQPKIQSAFAEDAAKIRTLTIEQVHYLLSDTVAALGVTNVDLIKQANDFWLAHFFSNEYCAEDLATPGAARYLDILERAGVKIVYLTGRDTPRMGEGTAENLKRNRFPTATALLIMKPDAKQDDLEFKKSKFAEIAAMGEVIGVFENEPVNINAMADAFPNAAAIFLDTIHSPKHVMPEARVEWVADFYF